MHFFDKPAARNCDLSVAFAKPHLRSLGANLNRLVIAGPGPSGSATTALRCRTASGMPGASTFSPDMPPTFLKPEESCVPSFSGPAPACNPNPRDDRPRAAVAHAELHAPDAHEAALPHPVAAAPPADRAARRRHGLRAAHEARRRIRKCARHPGPVAPLVAAIATRRPFPLPQQKRGREAPSSCSRTSRSLAGVPAPPALAAGRGCERERIEHSEHDGLHSSTYFRLAGWIGPRPAPGIKPPGRFLLHCR